MKIKRYDYVLNDACGIIKISFDIINTGNYNGDEVAQLYCQPSK